MKFFCTNFHFSLASHVFFVIEAAYIWVCVCVMFVKSISPTASLKATQSLASLIFGGCYLCVRVTAADAASYNSVSLSFNIFYEVNQEEWKRARSVFIIMIIVCHYIAFHNFGLRVVLLVFLHVHCLCLSRKRNQTNRSKKESKRLLVCTRTHSHPFKYANTKIQNYISCCSAEYILMILHYAPVRLINTCDCDKYWQAEKKQEKRDLEKAREERWMDEEPVNRANIQSQSPMHLDRLMKNGNYVQNELLDISFFELIIIQPLLAHSAVMYTVNRALAGCCCDCCYECCVTQTQRQKHHVMQVCCAHCNHHKFAGGIIGGRNTIA